MARTPIVAIASLLVLSCNSGSPTTPGGFHPLHEKANSLTISGPARVAPGTTAQYTATGRMADGTTQDISSKALWRTSSFSVLTVSTTGLVTTRANGETIITASSGEATASLSVMVLPNGTYRLAGTVRDADQPVASATVRVTAGQGTGASATTNSLGQYVLYGVAGEVELTVTRSSYTTVTHQVAVDHDDVFDITDFTVVGLPKIAGTYALTIAAGTDCEPYPASMLRPPASELQRTYAATVTQNGTNVTVTLSGADFAVQNGVGNQFFGSIGTNGYLNFSLRNTGGDYYYTVNTVGRPDVVERVSSGHLLAIWGYVYTPATTGGISADLYGGFIEYDPASGGAPTKPVTSCYSYQNRFQLTPTAGVTRRR
jgi:hypothetical protein